MPITFGAPTRRPSRIGRILADLAVWGGGAIAAMAALVVVAMMAWSSINDPGPSVEKVMFDLERSTHRHGCVVARPRGDEPLKC